MPLTVPTYLFHSDLRHEFKGSDMVGPAPPRKELNHQASGGSCFNTALVGKKRVADHRVNGWRALRLNSFLSFFFNADGVFGIMAWLGLPVVGLR